MFQKWEQKHKCYLYIFVQCIYIHIHTYTNAYIGTQCPSFEVKSVRKICFEGCIPIPWQVNKGIRGLKERHTRSVLCALEVTSSSHKAMFHTNLHALSSTPHNTLPLPRKSHTHTTNHMQINYIIVLNHNT